MVRCGVVVSLSNLPGHFLFANQFSEANKQFLFSLRENCERVILIALLQFSLHALESFYHTEILLHVVINLTGLANP